MTSLSKPLAKSILLFGTGIFAGLGTTLNLATVPALLASSDPVPTWKLTYEYGKRIAFSTIIPTSVAGIYLWFKCHKAPYLISSLLMMSAIPWTIFVMGSINSQLNGVIDGEKVTEEHKELITKWGKRQWMRTLFGVSAFVTNIYIIYWN